MIKMVNLIKQKRRLFTKNLTPGVSVYGERLIRIKGKEYREWVAKKSKLGAALMKGVASPFKEESFVLYLGAATGTTVSHISDLVPRGRVYAIEFAPEPMKKLILLAKKRKNIIPIFADANKPESYKHILSKCDIVFQDVAQKNQVEIFIKNCKNYLKRNGTGMLAIKSRSIDVTANPSKVFREVEKKLSPLFKIEKSTRLEPYEKDHKFYVLKWK